LKIFLGIGNKDCEDMIREGNYDVVDAADELSVIEDILNYIEVDGLIINRLLDDNGSRILRIAKRAFAKNIKVIILMDDYEDYEERKLITALVNEGVTAFISFKDLTAKLIEDTFENYPEEFDFSLFIDKAKETKDKVKSLFKEIITVYSPCSEGSSFFSAHFAVALARAINCRVCLVDFNPLKPRQKEIFDMSFEHSLSDALDGVVRKSLTPDSIENITKQCKYQKNLDILFGIYDLNDYYSSRTEYYDEILERLKFTYDYVIVDTHSWFDVSPTDAALRKADRVLVPIRGRRYSLEEAHRYFETFEKYNDFDVKKFGLVINQYSGKDLTSVELSAQSKYPILGYISKHQEYDEKNAFKNQRLMNEYVDVLKSMNIEAKKKREWLKHFRKKEKIS